MSDIFLSYARADRPRIETLVAALEEAGYSVWWDQSLTAGGDFSKDIEHQLEAAKAVIVAWSRDSVNSHWVRDEADSGRRLGKLVPVTLDGTPPPMGFRQTHTIDLTDSTSSAKPMSALASALDVKIEGRHATPNLAAEKKPIGRAALLALPIAALALGAGAYFAYPEIFGGAQDESVQDTPAALAIMPFTTPGDPDQAYIGQGISAKLASDLSAFPRLRIIAGTSTNAMAEQSLTAKDIGERFDIGAIIEGEIVGQEDDLIVRVRLVDTETTQLLWSSEVEGRADDLQALENALLLDIASALQSRLGIAGAPAQQELDVDQAAYDAYLRGLDGINLRGFFDPEEKTRREAYRALTRAVELQPDFADAWAARAYLGLLTTPAGIDLDDVQRRERIRSDFDRALELDSDNRLALAAKARWLVDMQGKIDESVEILDALLERSPDYHPALYHMTIAHVAGGDHAEALTWAERLVASDPFNVAQLGALMIATWRQYDYRNYVRAMEDCELCVGKTRFWAFALTGIASPAEIREDSAEAFAAIRADMPPWFARHYIASIEAIGAGSRPPRETIDWLLSQHLPEFALAARFGAGDEALDRALEYVEEQSSAANLPLIMVDARISFPPELRADPRYHALFDNEYGRNLLAYKRRHGIPDGMPLKASEVEAEKRRMDSLPFNAAP